MLQKVCRIKLTEHQAILLILEKPIKYESHLKLYDAILLDLHKNLLIDSLIQKIWKEYPFELFNFGWRLKPEKNIIVPSNYGDEINIYLKITGAR